MTERRADDVHAPDTLRALVTVRGWDGGRAQDWLTANLSRELLAHAGSDAE